MILVNGKPFYTVDELWQRFGCLVVSPSPEPIYLSRRQYLSGYMQELDLNAMAQLLDFSVDHTPETYEWWSR